MLWLSEVMLQNQDRLDSFEALEKIITEKAKAGEMFFRMDIKPPFQDTPEDWESRLEAAFATTRN